jgi:hypothetical protein
VASSPGWAHQHLLCPPTQGGTGSPTEETGSCSKFQALAVMPQPPSVTPASGPGQGEAQEEGHPTFSARCVPHLTHHPVCRCLRPQLWSVALEQHQIVHHAPLCLPFALATIQV